VERFKKRKKIPNNPLLSKQTVFNIVYVVSGCSIAVLISLLVVSHASTKLRSKCIISNGLLGINIIR
tara:strand:+ start:2028 stop:2228 length:201 start_codon:yes stop_codon:yes gene_type:complete